MFPANDDQHEETHVHEVTAEAGGGWTIKRGDGWSFFVPADSPIAPQAGMLARFYGKGVGFSVRGLYLAGVKVFYRTEAEEVEHQEIALYGADCADWLKRWDEGRSVWSIEMGGLGPGYEQCIHITMAEILRHMLAEGYDWKQWEDKDTWGRVRDAIETYSFENSTIKQLGLSGAQWGAALNLASHLYRDGPRKIMADERVKDRKIQVQRTFPQAAAA